MKQPLTKKQFETWIFLNNYADDFGYMPSIVGIKNHFKLASNDSAWERLNWLEKKGWIKRKKHSPRWIKLL